jgi:hypothetical protein
VGRLTGQDALASVASGLAIVTAGLVERATS